MSLGGKIKEQRKHSGLSQEKVAELVGVSRQAVTKWETGQSAPSTENLFKLAEIFGTTVDMLLDSDKQENDSPAEQIYYLYKMEKAKKVVERRAKRQKNILVAVIIAIGYLLVNLLGRVVCGSSEQNSVMGWLFGTDANQLPYLLGWLLQQNLFWIAMAISVVPALLGKHRFSFTTFTAFVFGVLFGELFGKNPYSDSMIYGQQHYGWAIWCGFFIFSIIMGIVLEKISKHTISIKSKKMLIWLGVFIVGIVAIVLIVLGSIPQATGN